MKWSLIWVALVALCVTSPTCRADTNIDGAASYASGVVSISGVVNWNTCTETPGSQITVDLWQEGGKVTSFTISGPDCSGMYAGTKGSLGLSSGTYTAKITISITGPCSTDTYAYLIPDAFNVE